MTGPTTAQLQRHAIEVGLDALGVCAAGPYDSTERAITQRREAGLFADLKFTMARPETSCHPETLVHDARSVVSAALSYWHPDVAHDPTDGPRGRVARYTRDDAYALLVERLDALAARLVEAGHAARVLVDSNDHVDREAAARSGVGFYGKHTNLITRRHGSWVVLGTIVTDAPLEPTPPMRAGCGSCTACIDACPTDAIVDAGVLDVGRCLTYWTQSRHVVPEPVREALGDMVYGCDICQDACPWNRGTESRSGDRPGVDGTVSLVDWLEAPADELDARYDRFFIPRRDVRFLRRNALIALGNVGGDAEVPLVASWLRDPSAMLREHARWALQRIGTPAALEALEASAALGDDDRADAGGQPSA